MIPAWNMAGVLPPIRPGAAGFSPDRSPYISPLNYVVEVFAFTPQRVDIFEGLLAYRNELHALGIVDGFQWLDGSFMEYVELLESRPPSDIDVVTFFELPGKITQKELFSQNEELFIPDKVKANFRVDGYPCILGEKMQKAHVRKVSYWYSMWSHRRTGLWKGFLQVGLSPDETKLATDVLNKKKKEVNT